MKKVFITLILALFAISVTSCSNEEEDLYLNFHVSVSNASYAIINDSRCLDMVGTYPNNTNIIVEWWGHVVKDEHVRICIQTQRQGRNEEFVTIYNKELTAHHGAESFRLYLKDK